MVSSLEQREHEAVLYRFRDHGRRNEQQNHPPNELDWFVAQNIYKFGHAMEYPR